MRGRGRRIASAATGVALVLAVAGAPRGGAQEPTAAPATTLSDGGRTVAGAGKVLRASQVADLDPAGQTVTVDGAGYDEHKGVYVSFCALPPAGHPPSPCGGGQDRGGTSGASTWISSSPPDYAVGLTTPYGPGGSFSTVLVVEPVIAGGVDCRVVRCAIVTRNDHTRGADRSQDLFLPVTFAPPPDPASPDPTVPPSTLPPLPTTTTGEPDPAAVPPSTTVAGDGRSVGDGARTLAVSRIAGLDPLGAELTATGTGFDASRGIYVALCRVPDAGAGPGPCTAGNEAAAWISSDPPDYGRGLARPFEDGGRFEVTLRVAARIDAETDCRVVACGIATRSDDTAPEDRRHDLLVPVRFAEGATAERAAPEGDRGRGAAAVAADDDAGAGAGRVVPIALGAGVLTGAVAAVLVRRRRLADGDDLARPPGHAEPAP